MASLGPNCPTPDSYDNLSLTPLTSLKGAQTSLLSSTTSLIENSRAHTSPRHILKTLYNYPWLWETLSLLSAFLSLCGFMLLLHHYDNRPNPTWFSGLSLNTVVSVISTVFRISMLVPVAASISQMGWVWLVERERGLDDVCCFDGASRGPWGGLRLVWRTGFV